jgi:hypothetical protein
MEQEQRKLSFGDRWRIARPTKTAFFWSCLASAVVTMIIGFTWGGWVRGATAQSMAESRAEHAVATRLAQICIVQARHDPNSAQKLKELKGLEPYERGDYVARQGWARMPGEQETDSRVAEDCAERLAQ